jgi:tRNA(His) 5'-end guanylyltransferase
MSSLGDRIRTYEEVSDIKLINAIPKIIIINGRNFKKTTSLLEKPFSEHFLELICGTMIKLASEIEGTILVYSFSDKIILAINNNVFEDQWYNGSIQKTASASAAIATYEFNRLATEKQIKLFGDPIFTSQVFNVPNITELCNSFVAFQQQAFHSTLTIAAFYELLKKYDLKVVQKMIVNKSASEKIEILMDKCNINYDSYPLPFKRGIASYRVPRVVQTADGEELKNKLIVDMELPLFVKEHDFLGRIFRTGHDLIRAK